MEISKNNIKSVTINTINQGELTSMITNSLINGKPLCWSNGTLFSFEPYAMTDWTQQEAAAGNIYYFSITHCKMDQYKEALTDDNNQAVPIINLDHHAFWKEILIGL